MTQPTLNQVHIDAALTQIATAYVQDNDSYIADKVFPAVPVEHRSNKYFKYRKGDFFRDEAQERADGTESAGTGYNLDTDSYLAEVWALHQDIGEQLRANADPSVDPEVAATKMLMQKMLIRRDRLFVTKYMTTGLWGSAGSTDVSGSATGTPGTTSTAYWNDDGNGDPFTDIAVQQTTILQNTGFEPNVLVLSYQAYQGLRKNPLVVDRIKYTSPAYAGKITPQLLAEAFDIDKVLVSKAVYNSANEGATDSFSFVTGKSALLAYAAPNAGLMVPSAGYIFPWQGFTGMNNMGVRVSSIPMPWRGLGTIRTEAEMAFDMKLVGSDLGVFFNNIVS